MRTRQTCCTLSCALAVAMLAFPLAAQQPVGDTELSAGKLRFHPVTDQQRWQRSAAHNIWFVVGAISYAKSRGDTPEDFGRHLGELFATGWGASNSGQPARMARAMVRNWMIFPGTEAEVVSASDTMAVVLVDRRYARIFGPNRETEGVTLDEYERTFVAVSERIAHHLGLRYAQSVEGDRIRLAFSGRGSAAVTKFPTGTYTVTLDANDAQAVPEVAGTWEVRFADDGRLIAQQQNGPIHADARYATGLDQITVGKETDPTLCPEGPGTYVWTVLENGVRLMPLEEKCEGRRLVLGSKTLSRTVATTMVR